MRPSVWLYKRLLRDLARGTHEIISRFYQSKALDLCACVCVCVCVCVYSPLRWENRAFRRKGQSVESGKKSAGFEKREKMPRIKRRKKRDWQVVSLGKKATGGRRTEKTKARQKKERKREWKKESQRGVS